MHLTRRSRVVPEGQVRSAFALSGMMTLEWPHATRSNDTTTGMKSLRISPPFVVWATLTQVVPSFDVIEAIAIVSSVSREEFTPPPFAAMLRGKKLEPPGRSTAIFRYEVRHGFF